MRILIATFLLSATAFADPPVDVRAMHDNDCARARKQGKTCVLDIESEKVEGNGVTPNGSASIILDFAKATSLIHIWRDFIVEILRTAEDL